mmetsp:Transcript_27800/g.64190  ORF Transcript_27800/g.64190 Transcript_27800/m.64190 type:complete len:416 (-) Transcript_27800:72-1319(-)
MAVVKTEAETAEPEADAEEPDFGDEAEPPPAPPQRAALDYADVVDEPGAGGTKEEVPAEDAQVRRGTGKTRAEVVHVSGVQRLGPANLLAVLALKDLPKFLRLQWVGDEEVLMMFDSAKEASSVLESLQAGFDDVPEGAGGKDPGVWRARRGMLDFRKATADDVAPLGFKRQRRAGRQVKEFRLWAQSQEVEISDAEEEDEVPNLKAKKLGLKNWRDWRKRATREEGGISDDEDVELLAQMANQDHVMLSKPHDEGDSDDEDVVFVDLLSQMHEQDREILTKEFGEYPSAEERKRRREEDESWQNRKRGRWQDKSNWQGEERWASGGRAKESWHWNTSSWDKSQEDWSRPAKRKRGSAEGGDTKEVDTEEKDRRRKRQERWMGGENSYKEVDNEEKERRKKRQERFVEAQTAAAS